MIAIIDFETTGLYAGEDEILQVSIIDENYNILFNKYCKPRKTTSWDEAQRVHGITPEMVENEKPFEDYVSIVRDVLESATNIIAYNVSFESDFLLAYNIYIEPEKWIDPMLMFAKIYGEYNEYYGNYKWQTLKTCAAYYDYDFDAHDALNDVKATLYCYKKMIEKEED